MEGLELVAIPPAATAKLMGSEGSLDACSSSLLERKELAFRNEKLDSKFGGHGGRPPDIQLKSACQDARFGQTNTSSSLILGPEAKHLQQKYRKIARTNSSCSKRSRVFQMAPVSEPEDVKCPSQEHPSNSEKCNTPEGTQLPKQKNGSNGKRSDRRNGKLPKSRCDPLPMKNGLVSFSSAAGGSNCLGLYGSRSDVFDITKHVDNPSLNELLDGSYKCPTSIKDTGKQATNSNENLLQSIRKAFSVLHLQKSTNAQHSAEMDNTYMQKVSTGIVGAGSSASGIEDEKADSCTSDLSAIHEESFGKLKTPVVLLDSNLHLPEEILERLALPPPKDLDLLLLDAAKPLTSRTNCDLRLGKSMSQRSGLPPFAWSHASYGHHKSGSDARKLSTSRNMCQGRWVKIGNSFNPQKGSVDFLKDFETLTYDQNLVPSGVLLSGLSRNENGPSVCASFGSAGNASSSSAMRIDPQYLSGQHSPRVLTAAETLCEMSTQSLEGYPHGMMQWSKRSSQKSASGLKSSDKTRKQFCGQKSVMGSDNQVKGNLVKVADDSYPLKKLRLSVDVKRNDIGNNNSAGKAPWSAPRSIRSSPSKLIREAVAESRSCSTTCVMKAKLMPPPRSPHRSYSTTCVMKAKLMPPPRRPVDKACSSQQQTRKGALPEWNRASSKLG